MVVVLVSTVVLYALARRLAARTGGAPGRRRQGRARATPAPSPSGSPARWCAAIIAAIVGVAALPNVSVLLLALSRDWYGTILPSGLTLDHIRAALAHDVVVPSIGNSLRYVTLSTAFDLIVGTTIAYLVTRTRSRAARVLDAAAMLPLAIPGLVMAFGYLAISREGRPLSFLNPLRDPTALLVIAYADAPPAVRRPLGGRRASPRYPPRSRRRRRAWAPARSRRSRASRCRCWRRT